MNRLIAVVLSLIAMCLSACAQFGPQHLSKSEYEKIFTEAINKSFAASKTNNVCLPQMFWAGRNYMEFTQAIVESSKATPGVVSQLNALAEAGLVWSSSEERTVNNKPITYIRYTRTAKGNQYFVNDRFCYAHAELKAILKWRGPAVIGDYAIAWVYFTAKATGVAEWAEDPAILAAFPDVRSTLSPDSKVRQLLIDLTSEGWEVNEWSHILQ